MEKTIKIIGSLKWICFVLGYIMYIFTEPAFGVVTGTALAVAATVSFWILMRNEQTRLIGESIVVEIKSAISDMGNVESFIEIKRIKSGIIARVYLVNAKEMAADIHRAITGRIEDCYFKKYLWIMQLTDMPNKDALKATQKILNDQLLEELMNKRKGE